ncbi:MAG: hypothetical protein RQ833_11885 [Sphingomonadaceae bacterium]|nr:hypothetical protein [Sphingomonadaceae bacterium]
MRRLACLVAVLFLSAAPALAQAPAPSREEIEAVGALAQRLDALVKGGDRAAAAAAIEKALADTPDPGAARGLILTFKSQLLASGGDVKGAREALEPAVLMLPNANDLKVTLAALQVSAGDGNAAAETLISLGAQNPKAVMRVDSRLVGAILQETRTKSPEAAFNLKLVLLQSGYTGGYGPEGLDDMRASVVEGLATRNRLDEAQPIAAELRNPNQMAKLAVDRRFERLWPSLESRGGPGFKTAIAGWAEATAATSKADPNNMKALAAAMQALRYAGKPADAAALAKPVLDDPKRIAAAPADAGWVIGLAAVAYAEAGDVAGGEQAFALLDPYDPLKDGELIGPRINQALMLLSFATPERALTVARSLAPAARTAANDYGRGYLTFVEACSLHRLGRGPEAASRLAEQPKLSVDNRRAWFGTQLCLDRPQAEDAMIAWLADPQERGDALLQFQRLDLATAPAFEKQMAERLERLAARPRLKAELARVGRVIRIAAPYTAF